MKQETAYSFGQLGNGFTDEGAQVTAPAGKVIIAMKFLEDTTFSALVADTSQGNDAAFFSHTAAVTGNGAGASETDAATIFPQGLTIEGRWTTFTPSAASTTGGIIFYFGI